jgi:glycosyltransferase involved in cell wall biosynthesis
MTKLLFITWSMSFGYGTERSLADILNRMDKDRYLIDVLPLFKNSDNNLLNSNIRILDSLIDYTKENRDEKKDMDFYYSVLGNPVKFNKLIKDKYDCIIACNHNAPSYLASYIEHTPKIVWVRGDLSELDYTKFDPLSLEYSRVKQEYVMQKQVFSKFDKIVAISPVVKTNLKNKFGINDNVYEIANSLDVNKVKSLSEEIVELPNKPLFTSIGRLDFNKNQLLLLKAAVLLRKRTDNFVIYLLGDGEDRLMLETFIRENNLQDWVKILGYQDNPYPYIKKSLATVLTSLSEGFCLALAESILLDTPVISTDVGIASELVSKYDCGKIIPYNEVILADALWEYLSNSEVRDEFKHFNIGNEFNVEVELAKTLEVIDDTISGITHKKSPLQYMVDKVDYFDLDNYKLKDKTYILEVKKNNVKYEYLINKRLDSDKLIVFNNGALTDEDARVPIFQRHSWIKDLRTSAIFCMDPTLYINDLTAVCGVGWNDDYYLENSSLILEKIIQKMNIKLENTVIYGSSAGGFLSIIMGTYLKKAYVVADNPQLDLTKWKYADAVEKVINYCFNNSGDILNYPERFNVVDTFIKCGYVPKIYLNINLCSEVDNSGQLIPFLLKLEKMKNILDYNNIEINLRYNEEKGHSGLEKDEILKIIYKVLNIEWEKV